MSDDTKQAIFNVDRDAHERAKKKLAHGELSKRLQQTVQEIAYGTDTTERRRLKEKLEDLREERRDIQNKIDNLRHEDDKVGREISRVEERLDTLMDKDGEYGGFLQAIEADLHDGVRFDPQHGKIETAADKGETTPQQVIQDLKERNPNVPEEAFREPKVGEPTQWKDTTELASMQTDSEEV